MYFDAANPYHRYMMHYESDQPLSLPEIIGVGSVDARTAAIVWQMLERRASVIVAGPTDPTPGVGKTTTLNALLPYYPEGTGLVYTVGMYEDFSFTNEVTATETTVLANEVSDHLRIYLWGRVARRFLKLPEQGYSIATTCHADTLNDVLHILADDIKLQAADIQRLPLIVNIGLIGRTYPRRRRWLTTHFIQPTDLAAPTNPAAPPATVRSQITARPVATWERAADRFTGCDAETMAAMAAWAGMTAAEFGAGVDRRAACLSELAQRGADQQETLHAIQELRAREIGA